MRVYEKAKFFLIPMAFVKESNSVAGPVANPDRKGTIIGWLPSRKPT